MTPKLLLEISKIVKLQDLRQMVCFTALLSGFFLMLRKSNMVPNAMSGVNGFDRTK